MPSSFTKVTLPSSLPVSLPVSSGVAEDVEQVVRDLEGEAEVLGEAADHLEVAAAGVGGHGAELAGGHEQGAGLVAVDVFEDVEVDLLGAASEVERLAADQAVGADRRRQMVDTSSVV